MLELATEMLRFNNQPKYNSKVSINVNSVKVKNNITTTKSSTNSTSTTNLLALHQELSDLKVICYAVIPNNFFLDSATRFRGRFDKRKLHIKKRNRKKN